MKVYVVMNGVTDDEYVIGIFRNRKDAEAEVTKTDAEDHFKHCYIEEYEVQ